MRYADDPDRATGDCPVYVCLSADRPPAGSRAVGPTCLNNGVEQGPSSYANGDCPFLLKCGGSGEAAYRDEAVEW